MATSAPTRELDGIELPAPGVWTVDPDHTEIAFVARLFMLTKVRGRFTGIDAVIDVAEDPEDTRVEATIDVSSLTSGNDQRDHHLRSADFFDTENWPTAFYRSTGLVWNGSGGTLTGELTIKDVTRPMVLDVEYLGHARDPWGADRAAFDATGQINREDWDVTWNKVLESGGLVISKEISFDFHVELVRQIGFIPPPSDR